MFGLGDIVELRSGSDPMTVISVDVGEDGLPTTYGVAFADGISTIDTVELPAEALVLAEEDGGYDGDDGDDGDDDDDTLTVELNVEDVELFPAVRARLVTVKQ